MAVVESLWTKTSWWGEVWASCNAMLMAASLVWVEDEKSVTLLAEADVASEEGISLLFIRHTYVAPDLPPSLSLACLAVCGCHGSLMVKRSS